MKTTLRTISAAAVVSASLLATSLQAQVITQFNFNSLVPDNNVGTGTLTPSTGTGTASTVGGATSTFATGSPGDTPTDNSGFNISTFAAQGANSGTTGAQFNISTVGFSGPIQISLDFRQSATASRYFQLQLSSDGVNFMNASGGIASILGPMNPPNSMTSFSDSGLYSNNSGSGSQTFVQGLTYTLAAGSIYENNANFAFRLVAVFDPNNNMSYTASNTGSTYSANGTARFDLVTVSVVPEPSTYALIGIGALLCLQRVRSRSRRRA